MRSRIQLILLSTLTLILAVTAVGLGVWTFKDRKGLNINYLAENFGDKGDNFKGLEEKTAIELNKDKKSDNLTQQTIASIIDILKSKGQNPELSDEELTKYLQNKMEEVNVFSYSFTKDDIKTDKSQNTKEGIENYLLEVYNLIPKETIFVGTLDINSWDNMESGELNKKLDDLIESSKKSFNALLQLSAPSEAVAIHETYLKLVNLETIFFEANKQMETDPMKAKVVFSNIKTELPILKQVLDDGLVKISQKYGIELQVTNQ